MLRLHSIEIVLASSEHKARDIASFVCWDLRECWRRGPFAPMALFRFVLLFFIVFENDQIMCLKPAHVSLEAHVVVRFYAYQLARQNAS